MKSSSPKLLVLQGFKSAHHGRDADPHLDAVDVVVVFRRRPVQDRRNRVSVLRLGVGDDNDARRQNDGDGDDREQLLHCQFLKQFSVKRNL